jgi:capsular polysaccharide biosynthesis protein
MYLSRSALGTADADVQQFELYLEDCLRTYVDIVYPEQLTLHEQIAQFKSRKYIMGKIGSALHLALFCDGGKRLSILVDREVTPSMHSYFKSLDALYDNSATYTNSTAIGTRQDAQSLADQLLSTLYKG